MIRRLWASATTLGASEGRGCAAQYTHHRVEEI
jgi:hypothetical protein